MFDFLLGVCRVLTDVIKLVRMLAHAVQGRRNRSSSYRTNILYARHAVERGCTCARRIAPACYVHVARYVRVKIWTVRGLYLPFLASFIHQSPSTYLSAPLVQKVRNVRSGRNGVRSSTDSITTLVLMLHVCMCAELARASHMTFELHKVFAYRVPRT